VQDTILKSQRLAMSGVGLDLNSDIRVTLNQFFGYCPAQLKSEFLEISPKRMKPVSYFKRLSK